MVKALGALGLLIVLAVGGAAFVLYTRVSAPFPASPGSAVALEIPAGSGTRSIGQRLVDAGIVRDMLTYRVALWMSGDARRLKAGEYRFDHPMTAAEVIGKIARGEVDLVNVTFREGLTILDMASLFEAQGFGPAASFRDAASRRSLIADLDPAAPDLEGYLFPETYAVSRHVTAEQLVRAMVEGFRRVLTPQLAAAASARGLSVRQLVTLASIVENETGAAAERPMVAAVYSNRLKIGMGLQCDPTVIYALQRAGKFNGNLTRDDLSLDSPYNTYRYAGLPPGPIAAPGRASLEAAAQPANEDFLYFVSRNDGTHAFARTLDEHNRNVERFQVQFFRERRLAERRREQAATLGR
ncbi:MAG TPA: endolytic transglycosylase MltG [Vicinamibacterales bacterium]|nr:endolytic transglycosylase MltG [Vicinamibacterales bacterium]